MASIFKRGRDKGKRHSTYYVTYFDHTGKRKTVKGFTDKGLTEQLAAKLENEAMLRRRGLIDPAQEKLAETRQALLEQPLEAFQKHIGDNTEDYISLVMSRVRRIIDGCGFKTVGDLDAEKITDFMRDLRKSEDLGARTFNHYMQAVESFGNWLFDTKRVPLNPTLGLPKLNAETDVRHARRALTPEEVARLIDSARTSGKSIQMYKPELRARLYLFSYLTGLRRKELASLVPESFKMNAAQPTVTVEAACSKHRREDVLPLHPELIELLKEWLPTLSPGQSLFPKLRRKKTWFMVKQDLERVGIAYETAEGIADFHAAGRHSHVTGLLRNGATLPEAKELARHTDIRMTMRYTHIGLDDQAKALANLPAPPPNWQHIGSTSRCQPCHSLTSGDTESADGSEDPETTNPCVSRGCVADCPDLSLVGTESEEWRQQDANRTFPSRRIRLGQHDSGTVQER